MSKIVNGSSLQPLSGGKPRQIVLLLHGYGSNGADLISFAPAWRQALPDALFLAPNAPQGMGMGGAYQWWGLNAFTPQALSAGADSAAPALDAFIDRKLTEYGLTEAQLAIVGFSQGTMMALRVGLRRPRQVAGIVGYSGMLVDPATLDEHICTRPPVLLIHGDADPVVPFAGFHEAKRELLARGFDVSEHVTRGLEHSVDPSGLAAGEKFIRRVLA